MKVTGELEEQDYELIRLFIATAAAAFENIHLNKELEATHREIIDTLGEMIECRFREMGNHVKRVAAFAQLLALKAGMDAKDAEILRFASPMHDIGKIGIPDVILKKPGRLTAEEFDVMKQHTSIGYNILKGSDRKILKYGATIALQHHERWDGLGYPNGLTGEEIHIIGRILRLVDVFDALGNERVYKKAWDLVEIVDYLKEERGKQFDPNLVDIFLENIEEFVEIKKQYPDEDLVNVDRNYRLISWINRRTVSRDLITGVVLVAGVVVLSMGMLNYYAVVQVAHHEMQSRLQRNSDIMIRRLARLMADKEFDTAIALLRDAKNDLPDSAIRLEDSEGNIIFLTDDSLKTPSSSSQTIERFIEFNKAISWEAAVDHIQRSDGAG